MKRYLPILHWITNYSLSLLKKDAIAGITVGVVLIPQGIAYAMIAGLPPIYGLYTALVPQIIYLLLGTSPKVAIGPVAMDSLLVAAAISVLSLTDPNNIIEVAILLAFTVGAFQFLLGILRLGFVVNFLSKPVISGFTSAAACIIGINQFNNLLGISMPRSTQFHELVQSFFNLYEQTDLHTFLIGGMSMLVLLTVKKINKNIPGPLLVVLLGILVVKFQSDYFSSVAIIKEIPSGFPSFGFPNFTSTSFSELIPIAFTLAMIGFLETVSIGKSMETSQDISQIKPNQELIALGFSNMIGSFFKSYPATASFSRSAVNQDAGARSGLASLFSVAVVGAVLLFFTPVFYYLPKTVLAGIIIVSILKLIDVKEAKRLWYTDRIDFCMLLVTFLGTLFFGIKEGIGVGVSLSLVMMVYRTSKPHIAVLGRIPNTEFFRNIQRFDSVEINEKVLIIRFDSHLYFANSNYFRDQLDMLSKNKGTSLQLIIIDCECINGLDSTGAAMWNDRIDFFDQQGVSIYFTNVKGPVRDAMTKAGIIDKIGIEHCFMSNQNALLYFETGNSSDHENLSAYIQQTND